MTAADLAQRLNARRSGAGWTARCPAHDDRSPSLSIRAGRDGRVLLRCWAGCDTAAVLAAAGLSWRDVCGDGQPQRLNRPYHPPRPLTAEGEWTAWCRAYAGGAR